MGTFLLLAVILGFTAYVIYKRIKNRKEGKSCCSGGCSSCPFSCSMKDQ